MQANSPRAAHAQPTHARTHSHTIERAADVHSRCPACGAKRICLYRTDGARVAQRAPAPANALLRIAGISDVLLGSKDDGSGHLHAFELLAAKLASAARVVVVLYAPAQQLELLPTGTPRSLTLESPMRTVLLARASADLAAAFRGQPLVNLTAIAAQLPPIGAPSMWDDGSPVWPAVVQLSVNSMSIANGARRRACPRALMPA